MGLKRLLTDFLGNTISQNAIDELDKYPSIIYCGLKLSKEDNHLVLEDKTGYQRHYTLDGIECFAEYFP